MRLKFVTDFYLVEKQSNVFRPTNVIYYLFKNTKYLLSCVKMFIAFDKLCHNFKNFPLVKLNQFY